MKLINITPEQHNQLVIKATANIRRLQNAGATPKQAALINYEIILNHLEENY